MASDRTFIRVKEAAELLGVSPNTIRTWGSNGKIPEYRHPVNNYRLYKRKEIEGIMSQVENTASRVSKPTARKRKT